MKAEHRKELQTNVLADKLGHVMAALKKGPSREVYFILGLCIAVPLLYLGWRYFNTSYQDRRSNLWLALDQETRRLDAAADLGQVEAALTSMEETAKEHKGTVTARALEMTRARELYYLGLEKIGLPRDREKASGQIQQARDIYAAIAREAASTPVLHQQALLGLAKARETLGEIDEALADYKKLAETYPKSAAGQTAQRRAEYLEKNLEQVKGLYAALEKTVAEK